MIWRGILKNLKRNWMSMIEGLQLESRTMAFLLIYSIKNYSSWWQYHLIYLCFIKVWFDFIKCDWQYFWIGKLFVEMNDISNFASFDYFLVRFNFFVFNLISFSPSTLLNFIIFDLNKIVAFLVPEFEGGLRRAFAFDRE